MPVLQGSATFNTANDLTVVDDGAVRLEFLDVSVTKGMSVAGALANYGGAGFHWATGTEVATLYSVFGTIYQSKPIGVVQLTAGSTQEAELASYLGKTLGDAAIGWIDDLATDRYHTFACIGTSCTPNSFVINTSSTSAWPANPGLGAYLVREREIPLPEPGTLALVALALCAAYLAVARCSSRGAHTGRATPARHPMAAGT